MLLILLLSHAIRRRMAALCGRGNRRNFLQLDDRVLGKFGWSSRWLRWPVAITAQAGSRAGRPDACRPTLQATANQRI